MLSPRLCLAVSLALACCVAIAQADVLVGGVQGEKQADDEVRQILTSVRAEIEKMAKTQYKSLEPISYRKQTVAGANYFVKALAINADGSKSHIHARIYRPFRGGLELTAIRTNLDATKPLEYFS